MHQAFPRLSLVLLVLLFFGCSAGEPDRHRDPDDHDRAPSSSREPGVVTLTPEQIQAAQVATDRATYRRLDPEIRTTGEVDYEQSRVAHVGPRIEGRVVQVEADLGDEVRRGDLLAVLDSVALGEARSRYLSAVTREELARSSFERQRALFQQGISSEQRLQETESAHREAMANRDGSAGTLRLYGVSPEQIAAQTERDTEHSAVSRLEIRAPVDGRVVTKHVSLGELVAPADTLFTLADLSRVWIWIDVFERDLAAVHEGDGVEVRVKAHPDRTFSGRVSYLASEVAPATRAVRARIDVPNPGTLLRPGMFADVRLTDPHGPSASPSLTVPQSALTRLERADDAETLVFVPLGDGRFRAQPVRTGRGQGPWMEILDGLEDGDAVVSGGAFFLKSELARDQLGGGHSH